MCVSCSKVSGGVQRKVSSVCNYLYSELASMDTKVYDLYNKSSNPRLVEVNKILRGWMDNLFRECPPEDELKLMREYIDNEYPKYFPT